MATYNFTVRAQDETGAFSDRDFSIQVRNNLVDRLLAIDANDAYASVDGTTWTQRVGKGGKWCRNLLGKWIVCVTEEDHTHGTFSNCGLTYRISDDTINWTENLNFWLSNDAPVYDEQGVEIEPAGPLYHQYFYPTRDQLTVINGKIIIPSIVNNKLCIVYSTDAINWYAYESNETSHESNMMGIDEDALAVSTTNAVPMTFKSRHGLSNVIVHNNKYTMINNHTCNFYVSDNLVDWDIVEITNKTTLENMNKTQKYNTEFIDNFWRIISVNNVLWMMGNHNHGYSDIKVSNYIFYTTNLNDVSYATNYKYERTDSSAASSSTWKYLYYHTTYTYDSDAIINPEFRQIYYANGVIFAYCGKNIVTTKTLTDNTRSLTYATTNRNYSISGSCFYEGDIYYTLRGTGTSTYAPKKLTIDSGEYTSASLVSGLGNDIIDITSV